MRATQNENYKFCPMLTVYKTYEPILIGDGAVTVPELHFCIGNKCAAHKDGFCNRYMTQVMNEEEGDEDAGSN